MPRFHALSLAAALITAATLPAAAQNPSQVIEVAGKAAPLPDRSTLRAMTGDYALADGRVLRVQRPGLHLAAALGDGWARSLEPVGPHRFATRDGRLTVDFEPGADGAFDTLRVIENNSVTVAARSNPLR
ncbi:MAG: hypothetical protein IV093_20865 [Rubrivivax sp.]|nr:hypothetical protein [Rubrivivax sp.]